MPGTPSARRPARSAGQSVYEVMLIIACAAMLLAVVFAAHEYISFYQGPPKPYKFEPTATTMPVSRPPAPARTAAPAPARTVTPAPAPTTTPTPGTTAAPATAATTP
ncbi:MAG: hypothetical protein ABSA67_00330 [Candidatus Brocadiia bacterium]